MGYSKATRKGKVVIESFENDNLKITSFLTGEVEIIFKPTCNKNVKKMYKKLIKRV